MTLTHRAPSGFLALSASALLVLGCAGDRPLATSPGPDDPARLGKASRSFATLALLPSLGGASEALAVDDAGTVVVGHSFDRGGLLYGVKWTRQSGAWVATVLPYPRSARAMGVSAVGDAVGYAAGAPRAALRWPAAGGSIDLDCAADAGESTAWAISAGGQVVVGAGAGVAALWRPGGCREALPGLSADGGSSASTVNGDGTIAGGGADGFPVRWREVAGQWQIEPLDGRRGRALGANAAGDLAGVVLEPCAAGTGCNYAVVWYAAGGTLDLGALGAERATADDINAAGEVVGTSTASGRSTAFIWSASSGARQLPGKRGGSVARAVSDVRADGTRLVAGMSGTQAAVWVVRDP